MYLGDILKIKAGGLIKGIRLVSHPSLPTRYYMNMSGWLIDGTPSAGFYKGAGSRDDPTTLIAPLTLIHDRDINAIAKELMPTRNASDLTTTSLLVNSRVMRESFTVHHNFRSVEAGSVVGMSLGDTIVSFQPEAPEIYRKGAASLACFHCVLIKEEVCWIRMMSEKRVAFFDEKKIQDEISSTQMELI